MNDLETLKRCLGERRTIELKIKIAQRSVEFWADAETKYRNDSSTRNSYGLIRAAKQHRKQAQSDLNYWRAQLDKVAA